MLCLVLENAPLMESQQAKFDRESYNFQTCGISFESSGLRSSLSMLAKALLGGERKQPRLLSRFIPLRLASDATNWTLRS